MTELDPRFYGVRSNRSTNWGTPTASGQSDETTKKTEEAEVSPILKKCLKNKCYSGTVVVVQLSERLLPIPEDPGSNSAISNFDWTYLLFTVCWKEKMGRRLGITFESQRCQSMRILLLEFYDRSVSRFFPLCQCDQIWRNF